MNKASEEVNLWLYNKTKQALSEGKFIGILGGDHSSPLGAMKAYCEHYTNFGVLHIDAHADVRLSYQGFSYSHASIMRNLMELNQAPSALVQVAVRDYCEEEWSYIQSRENIKCFFDRDLKKQLFLGTQWHNLCHSIIKSLPPNVYVSFDIDGLSPESCPHTGTPVPGGLSYDQAIYLLAELRKSDRQVVGFDLCEVAPHPNDEQEWDSNVGARLLYQLCGLLCP